MVEVTISLSKIIKSTYIRQSVSKEKVIELKRFEDDSNEKMEDQEVPVEEQEMKLVKNASAMMEEAKRKAELIHKDALEQLEHVQMQITEERNNWETERSQLIEEAHKEGYLQGLDEGKQAGFNEYKEIILGAKQTLELAKQEYLEKVEKAEQTIITIGIKVAEKIIDEKLTESPMLFENIVKKVIKEVKDHPEVKVYVHPSNYEDILSNKHELEVILNDRSSITIYPDDELSINSCLIESPYGRIDASVACQLTEIKGKLLQLHEEVDEGDVRSDY